MNNQEVIEAVKQEYTDYRSNMLEQYKDIIYNKAYEITVVRILMEYIVYDNHFDDFTDDEVTILYNGSNGKILNYLLNEYWTSVYNIDENEDVTALIDYCIRQIRSANNG